MAKEPDLSALMSAEVTYEPDPLDNLSTEIPVPPKIEPPKLTRENLGKLKVQSVTESRDIINLMIYADSGWGKTTFAGSCTEIEELDPVIFIDVEGGTFSLRDKYPTAEVVRVASWTDMQNIYNELYKMQHGYKTVVLDSVTEMQKFSMYNIMLDVVKADPDRDPDIPSLREWGKNIEQMRKMIRAFRDLPMNTIFTALAMEQKNPKTGKSKTLPSMSGKLSGEVAAFIDIVLYGYIKVVNGQQQRLILTSGLEDIIAKDRSNRLPTVIEDITMRNIYNLIYGVK